MGNNKKELVIHGILSKHDLPVDAKDWEYNNGVLFVHNELLPLATMIHRFSDRSKVSIYYYTYESDSQKTESQVVTESIKGLYSGEVGSSSHPISEITPDLIWTHNNEFRIGGHDMNQRLDSHIGQWLFMK